jgi:hypothetical protein
MSSGPAAKLMAVKLTNIAAAAEASVFFITGFLLGIYVLVMGNGLSALNLFDRRPSYGIIWKMHAPLFVC